MSPLQKSEIVRMMKNSPLKPVTAAIGDGGNDVAMIQVTESFNLLTFLYLNPLGSTCWTGNHGEGGPCGGPVSRFCLFKVQISSKSCVGPWALVLLQGCSAGSLLFLQKCCWLWWTTFLCILQQLFNPNAVRQL